MKTTIIVSSSSAAKKKNKRFEILLVEAFLLFRY